MNHLGRCQSLLGTFVSIDVDADASDTLILTATAQAFDVIRSVQACMSFHDTNSELSQLNASAHLVPVKVSPMMEKLLDWCLKLSRDSAGLFDVSVGPLLCQDKRLPDHWSGEKRSVSYESIELTTDSVFFKQPMALDFGGVAKGLAVDLAFEVIKAQLSECVSDIVVNAGGDMRVLDWKQQPVGIISQHDIIEKHEMKSASVASSSGYYHEGISDIYHPHHQVAQALENTVSVFAAQCQWADALTKIACLDVNHPVLAQYDAAVLIS